MFLIYSKNIQRGENRKIGPVNSQEKVNREKPQDCQLLDFIKTLKQLFYSQRQMFSE